MLHRTMRTAALLIFKKRHRTILWDVDVWQMANGRQTFYGLWQIFFQKISTLAYGRQSTFCQKVTTLTGNWQMASTMCMTSITSTVIWQKIYHLPSMKNLIRGLNNFMYLDEIFRLLAMTFGRCSLPFAVYHLPIVFLPFAVYQLPSVCLPYASCLYIYFLWIHYFIAT